MDQKYIVGVGNIYASEALFRAGIAPTRQSGAITRPQAEKLAAAIQGVLRDALQSRGSTLRDHRQLDGSTGYFQHHFSVYGRAGEDCTCGIGQPHTIKSLTQGGRTTFFCPVKQR